MALGLEMSPVQLAVMAEIIPGPRERPRQGADTALALNLAAEVVPAVTA